MHAIPESFDDYMRKFSPALGAKINNRLRPRHSPGKHSPEVAPLKRKPYPAQAHCITAAVKTLRHEKGVVLVGECGTGKTLMGMATVHTRHRGKPYRAIVMCPPHLAAKWVREISETIPGARVVTIARKVSGLVHLRKRVKPTGPEWYVITQSDAKFNSGWKTLRAADDDRRTRNATEGAVCCHICGLQQVDIKYGIQVPISYEAFDDKMQRNCDFCGHQMWTYYRRWKRWPLAQFIHRYLEGVFTDLIVDEVHEEKADASLQGVAMGTLASSVDKVVALTGTLIGGYAAHIRALMWRMAPRAMANQGLDWDSESQFVSLYGRYEYKITETTSRSGLARSGRGRQSGTTRKVSKNVRPGIMPQLYGDILLPYSVFLSLNDVASELPELQEKAVPIDLTPAMLDYYKQLKNEVRNVVATYLARGDTSPLSSMLSVLLSYPDRPFGWGKVQFRGRDGTLQKLCSPRDWPVSDTFPKEQWLVDTLLQEKAEGNQSWVFTTMTDKLDVCERLQKKITAAGLKCCILRSAKVPTRTREEWINEVGPHFDVILSHPKVVETGVDLFAKNGNHNFSTLIFYLTGYNTFTMRQASRRAWRIAQTKLCKVFYAYYAETMQETAMRLMGEKLMASEALEGTFSTEGLVAMLGDSGSLEMELARSLVNDLQHMDVANSWEKVGSFKPPVRTDDYEFEIAADETAASILDATLPEMYVMPERVEVPKPQLHFVPRVPASMPLTPAALQPRAHAPAAPQTAVSTHQQRVRQLLDRSRLAREQANADKVVQKRLFE
jgi:SNF2 family DNA or RNA helicase